MAISSRTVWFFDLDNTLHDASRAVFGRLDVAITDYIVRELALERDAADALLGVGDQAGELRDEVARQFRGRTAARAEGPSPIEHESDGERDAERDRRRGHRIERRRLDGEREHRGVHRGRDRADDGEASEVGRERHRQGLSRACRRDRSPAGRGPGRVAAP